MAKKILVVDDEKPISDIIKFNLEKEGYEVVVAYDGEEALEKVESEQPDLIDRSLLKQAFEQMEEKSFISGWYSEKIRNLIDSIPKVNDTVKGIIEKEPDAITLDISDTCAKEKNGSVDT